ncbi:hypothetical protein LXA43DRAFT_1064240 [Ganoderma leucocontextum]|nr:hypothetical protein LXA43DRAFT_1064240 [Ganoderma leucocontextum]
MSNSENAQHRPPVGNSRRAEYDEEIVKRVKSELVQYVVAHRCTGPISVSPFISASLVQATPLAQDGNIRKLDLENLNPSRAFTSAAFPFIEGYDCRNVHGWWARRVTYPHTGMPITLAPSTRDLSKSRTPLPPASAHTIGSPTTPATSSTMVPLTTIRPPCGFKKSKLAGPSNADQKAAGNAKKG